MTKQTQLSGPQVSDFARPLVCPGAFSRQPTRSRGPSPAPPHCAAGEIPGGAVRRRGRRTSRTGWLTREGARANEGPCEVTDLRPGKLGLFCHFLLNTGSTTVKLLN